MKIDDFEKKTGEKQINIEDDFFKMPQEPIKSKEYKEHDSGGGFGAKLTNLLPVLLIAAFVLIIAIGVATVFLRNQISALNNNLIYLNKIVGGIDTAALKSEMTTMQTTLDRVNNENSLLRADVNKLKNDLEALRARKEKPAAPAQTKPAAQKKPGPQKKPGGSKPRTR